MPHPKESPWAGTPRYARLLANTLMGEMAIPSPSGRGEGAPATPGFLRYSRSRPSNTQKSDFLRYSGFSLSAKQHENKKGLQNMPPRLRFR